MGDRNTLVRGVLATISLYVLIVLTFFLPYFSLLTIWLIPLPLMYLGARDGWKPMLCSFGVAILFLLLIDHSWYLFLPVFFMVLGMVLGFMIHLKKSAFALLLAGSLTSIAMLIICLAVSVLVFHFNPASAMRAAMDDSFRQTLEQMGPMLEQSSDELETQYQAQLDLLGRLTPLILMMMGVSYALIVELIGLPILRRLKIDVPRWVPFRDWQVPRSVVWCYLVVFFAEWFVGDNTSPFLTALLNIEFLLSIMLTIQGFSLIYYYAHARKYPVIVPVTVTLLVFVFGFLLMQMVCILGIIDLGFKLRGRIVHKGR